MSLFSIITPNYNMLPYLKLCAVSISDQQAVEVEHIIVDGASTDGTVEWLSKQKNIRSVSEKDQGMYDAVNKGLVMAKGDILAYLNCDEQYLPGTLAYVEDYFEKHPGVEILFGDLLLIRPDGTLIAYSKGYQPRWFYILSSHLYVLSCTMFFRRKVLEDGFLFDKSYRSVADADFIVRLLRKGYKAEHVKHYFSAFTMTGKNLSEDNISIKERRQLLKKAPVFVKAARPVINLLRLTEKFFSGAYFQKGPFLYSVYVSAEEDATVKRKTFTAKKASFRWRF